MVGQDFRPLSGIRQGSLEVGQTCTCVRALLCWLMVNHLQWQRSRSSTGDGRNLVLRQHVTVIWRAALELFMTYDFLFAFRNADGKEAFEIVVRVNSLGGATSCRACFGFSSLSVLFNCRPRSWCRMTAPLCFWFGATFAVCLLSSSRGICAREMLPCGLIQESKWTINITKESFVITQ